MKNFIYRYELAISVVLALAAWFAAPFILLLLHEVLFHVPGK